MPLATLQAETGGFCAIPAQVTRSGTGWFAMAQDDDKPKGAGLPAVVMPRPERAIPVRGVTPAPFLSQLIAARARITLQRERNRAPLGQALDAYAAGSAIAVRRMPQGFRKTVVA